MRRQGGVFWCAGFIARNRLRNCCHLTAECLKTGNPVVHRYTSVEPPADAGGCSRCAPQLVVRITRVLFYLRVGEQNGQCISRCTQVKVKVRFCCLPPFILDWVKSGHISVNCTWTRAPDPNRLFYFGGIHVDQGCATVRCVVLLLFKPAQKGLILGGAIGASQSVFGSKMGSNILLNFRLISLSIFG